MRSFRSHLTLPCSNLQWPPVTLVLISHIGTIPTETLPSCLCLLTAPHFTLVSFLLRGLQLHWLPYYSSSIQHSSFFLGLCSGYSCCLRPFRYKSYHVLCLALIRTQMKCFYLSERTSLIMLAKVEFLFFCPILFFSMCLSTWHHILCLFFFPPVFVMHLSYQKADLSCFISQVYFYIPRTVSNAWHVRNA